MSTLNGIVDTTEGVAEAGVKAAGSPGEIASIPKLLDGLPEVLNALPRVLDAIPSVLATGENAIKASTKAIDMIVDAMETIRTTVPYLKEHLVDDIDGLRHSISSTAHENFFLRHLLAHPHLSSFIFLQVLGVGVIFSLFFLVHFVIASAVLLPFFTFSVLLFIGLASLGVLVASVVNRSWGVFSLVSKRLGGKKKKGGRTS